MRKLCVGLIGAVFSLPAFGAALGPSPYLSFADSPFAGLPFGYFHLETFEDGLLNVPGVTVNGAPEIFGNDPLVDSVDADDGSIDGFGSEGHALYSNGNTAFAFTFDANVLGGFPTHAGIVFTDIGANTVTPGFDSLTFEAFDSAGTSLGVTPPALVGDGDFRGTTAEDRFFGWVNTGGISKIILSSVNDTTDWEVDHLQFGREGVPTPEGGSLLAPLLTTLFVLGRFRGSITTERGLPRPQ